MINLTIEYRSKPPSELGFQDYMIEEICEGYLGFIIEGQTDLYIIIGQELMLYMFRALLYKKYRHLQDRVAFVVDNVEVKFYSNMRNASGIYPPSIFDQCCDVLLGAV